MSFSHVAVKDAPPHTLWTVLYSLCKEMAEGRGRVDDRTGVPPWSLLFGEASRPRESISAFCLHVARNTLYRSHEMGMETVKSNYRCVGELLLEKKQQCMFSALSWRRFSPSLFLVTSQLISR